MDTTNFVDLLGPEADEITGATAAPNIATSFDGADGILIYKRKSLHRIVDDSDNVAGVFTGGSNVLVDASTGTLSNASIVHQNGRIYCVAQNGIYSTDGHTSQALESGRLGRFFPTSLPTSKLEQSVAAGFQGTILVASPASPRRAAPSPSNCPRASPRRIAATRSWRSTCPSRM
jgi:hypothetical protein